MINKRNSYRNSYEHSTSYSKDEQCNLADVPGIKRIIPQKYVWHLSPRRNRKSIMKKGLISSLSEHNCVFANNQSVNIDLFYPFCVNIYYDRINEEDYLEYDYWRIDTSKIQATWYIDPNLSNGPREYMGKNENFIVTETSIPPNALKLYRIDPQFLRTYKIYRVWTELEDGVIEIWCYWSKDKMDLSGNVIEVEEIEKFDICRIKEEVFDGSASFIVDEFPLIVNPIAA